MDKEVLLEVWMDPEDKKRAEELYKGLGTSFEEAVRIFAKQSILENGMPFRMVMPKKNELPKEGKEVDNDLPSKKVIVREDDGPDISESFVSSSCGGFSAEMAIEKALASKHGEEVD